MGLLNLLNINRDRIKKGLSLAEVMVSLAIISLIIGVLVQIFLIYNKIKREQDYLTNDTLTVKEVGIKIEKAMALSRYVRITNNIDNTIIETYDYTFTLKKNPPKEFKIETNPPNPSKTKVKQISNYIYWVANTYYNNPVLYESKIYVYNRASKGRYIKNNQYTMVRKLAYCISITKYY